MQERVGRERSPRASKLPRAITEERRRGRTSADVACGDVARSPDAEWRAQVRADAKRVCTRAVTARPATRGSPLKTADEANNRSLRPRRAPKPPTFAWNSSGASGAPDTRGGLFNRGCFACAIRPAPRSRAAPVAQPTCRVGSPARESPLRGSGAAASIAANPLGCPLGLRGVTLTHRT